MSVPGTKKILSDCVRCGDRVVVVTHKLALCYWCNQHLLTYLHNETPNLAKQWLRVTK